MSNQMKQLLAFHTGLLATDYYRFPDTPYKGKGWQLDFRTPVSDLPIASEVVNDKIYQAKEVIISAHNEITAQRGVDLIHTGRLLTDGSNLLSHLYPGEHAPIAPADFPGAAAQQNSRELPPHTVAPNIPFACLIAARASTRLKYIYALAKLRLSFETYSLPVIELDPSHSPNIPKSQLPEDHIRLAFAIVTAYSCIEELGFEVRASDKKPAKIDGKWNPPVKQDLETRLFQGRIDLKELSHWNLRGPRTLIEKQRVPEISEKAKWATYPVRDGKMEVIDAINYVSFLRSKVSAHKANKKLVRVLSVYDVSNAQMLARRLLMQTLGYWRYSGVRAAL